MPSWSVRPCVRPVDAARTAAGHDALREVGPDQKHAFWDALAQVGCPASRLSTGLMHHRFVALPTSATQSLPALYLQAATTPGSRYRSPLAMIAQAIRAILLASATAATLVGRRARSLMIHGRFVPYRSAYRMTASAPTVSIERRYLLPCLVMPPSRSLPPLEFCLGTNPIQAAKLRAEAKARGSGTVATRAVASSGPMPGISASRRLMSLERWHAAIRRSMSRILLLTSISCSATATRQSRASAGTRSSSRFDRTANSWSSPRRPIGATMPNSATWARIV